MNNVWHGLKFLVGIDMGPRSPQRLRARWFGLRATAMLGAVVLFLAGCNLLNPPGPTTLSAPTGVTATAVATGDGQIAVSWKAVSGATSYSVYWKAGSTVGTSTGTKIANATSPTIVNNVPQGTQYAFAVTAVNSSGESAASSVATATLPTTTNHVYATGWDGYYPAYWKDGVVHTITANKGWGQLIAVTSSDVVIAGERNDVTPNVPVYWDNGAMTSLSIPTNTTFAWFDGLGVSGSTIVVTATVKDASGNKIPVQWLNGSLTQLSTGTDPQGDAGGVAFDASGNVDVAGDTQSNTGGSIVYWQNGVLQSALIGGWVETGVGTNGVLQLSASSVYLYGTTYVSTGGVPVYISTGGTVSMTGTAGTDYIAASMAVSGADVYVSGSAEDQSTSDASGTPAYWKNSTLNSLPLPNGVANGSADFIVASGSDVYIAGDEVDVDNLWTSLDPAKALYWVNGALVSLAYPSGDTLGRINGLQLSGSDVYAAGTSGTSESSGSINGNAGSHAVYWKNGNVNVMPDTSGGYDGINWLVVAPY